MSKISPDWPTAATNRERELANTLSADFARIEAARQIAGEFKLGVGEVLYYLIHGRRASG
jgi:hypothetical protein